MTNHQPEVEPPAALHTNAALTQLWRSPICKWGRAGHRGPPHWPAPHHSMPEWDVLLNFVADTNAVLCPEGDDPTAVVSIAFYQRKLRRGYNHPLRKTAPIGRAPFCLPGCLHRRCGQGAERLMLRAQRPDGTWFDNYGPDSALRCDHAPTLQGIGGQKELLKVKCCGTEGLRVTAKAERRNKQMRITMEARDATGSLTATRRFLVYLQQNGLVSSLGNAHLLCALAGRFVSIGIRRLRNLMHGCTGAHNTLFDRALHRAG